MKNMSPSGGHLRYEIYAPSENMATAQLAATNSDFNPDHIISLEETKLLWHIDGPHTIPKFAS